MTADQLDAKMKELTSELEKATDQLAKLRPQVTYLENMQQRLDGALTVLQGLREQEKQAVVTAQPASSNAHVLAPVGA